MKARRFAVLWERWLAHSTEETFDEWLAERRARAVQRRNFAVLAPQMQQASQATLLQMQAGLQNVPHPLGGRHRAIGGALGNLFPF